MWWLTVVMVSAIGCIHPDSTICDDGRACPSGTVCDELGHRCLFREQLTACAELVPGMVCEAGSTPGICDANSLCVPGCGDGVQGGDEECDDGNFASHDGCSSRCAAETPTWTRFPGTWLGPSAHNVAYHMALGRLVMVGGIDERSRRSQIWQRSYDGGTSPTQGWVDVTAAFDGGSLPPARAFASMVYDSTRNVIVLFGGQGETGDMDDTWEYAAGTGLVDPRIDDVVGVWTKRSPTSSPPARSEGAMAYDPVRQRVVMYGGIVAGSAAGDQWEYDGTTWTRTTLAPPQPGARGRHGMVWDESRGKTVLFGGQNGETDVTWEWDGSSWAQVSGTTPPPKSAFAMGYDPERQKVVIHGGFLFGGAGLTSDTWEYDGTWTQMTAQPSPDARRAASMAFDPQRHALVLVGGANAAGTLADVWEEDVAGWHAHSPRFATPASFGSATAYRSVDERIYAFAGYNPINNEMWSFDGARWSLVGFAPFDTYLHSVSYDSDRDRLLVFGGGCSSDCGPGEITTVPDTWEYAFATQTWTKLVDTWPGLARYNHVAAYDPMGHELIAFGGSSDSSEAALDDTWTFDGATWTEQTVSDHPAPSFAPLGGWDPPTNQLVVFDDLGDTWGYAQHAWTKLVPNTPGETPPPRVLATMTYDPARRRQVLMGGSDAFSGVGLLDVWELDAAARAWHVVDVPGISPLPRIEATLTAHASSRQLILDAGRGALVGSKPRDTWALEYGSSTPDEDCSDGMDTDGDLQSDADDPDCSPP